MDMPTFDELRDLAQRDPEGFENLRMQLIHDCIERSAGRNQRRLQGLQFVIDGRRRVAGTPMKALLDIQAMMHESLLGLQRSLLLQRPPSELRPPTKARTLSFPN
ncbi:MAG: DUF3135 domain-containing protein [Marinobacter sp.]